MDMAEKMLAFSNTLPLPLTIVTSYSCCERIFINFCSDSQKPFLKGLKC